MFRSCLCVGLANILVDEARQERKSQRWYFRRERCHIRGGIKLISKFQYGATLEELNNICPLDVFLPQFVPYR